MPELPEVEILVRHLADVLPGRTVRRVVVHRERVVRPTAPEELVRQLAGARFVAVRRRAKFLLFTLARGGRRRDRFMLLGHLGMTGRMYLQPRPALPPKHAAVSLELDRGRFVYEDPRYFGRFTLDLAALADLGPEPLNDDFGVAEFAAALGHSAQPIKVKLLDQSLVAGIGNIYASEALHRARISPRRAARRLDRREVAALWRHVRAVLREAIQGGSTLPLDWAGAAEGDGLFYYGRAADAPGYYHERLWVYDRHGQPCRGCRTPIRRIVQAGRSTFFCPVCQR